MRKKNLLISMIDNLFKVNVIYSAIFNFRHFGFNGLLKMPVVIDYGSKFKCKSNNSVVFLKPLQSGMLFVKSGTNISVDKGGKIVLKGVKACFKKRNSVFVSSTGVLEIGNNFSSNGNTEFNCRRGLKFGDDVIISVNVMFLDTDFHPIFNKQGERINPDREIVVGNKVWIGCNVTILKGSIIGNNIIIGAGSLVAGKLLTENSIYCGNPVRFMKGDTTWHLNEIQGI